MIHMTFFKKYSLITFGLFLASVFVQNEIFTLIAFSNTFLLYPFYLLAKLLKWFLGLSPTGDKRDKRFIAQDRAKELIIKLEEETNKNKIKNIKDELKSLIKEHKSTLHSIKRLQQRRAEFLKESAERRADRNSPEKIKEKTKRQEKYFKYGSLARKIKCPHCGEVGYVHRRTQKNLEETRQKGIVGTVIGQKTITDKGMITKFYCDNCKTQWTA